MPDWSQNTEKFEEFHEEIGNQDISRHCLILSQQVLQQHATRCLQAVRVLIESF